MAQIRATLPTSMELYIFKATTAVSGEELYKYASSTLTLIDIETGINSSNPEYLTNVNGTFIFCWLTPQPKVQKYVNTQV